MKKMMIMMAVAFAAAVTQAASVSWQISNVRVPTQTVLTIGAGNAKFTTAEAASSLVMKLYLVPTSGAVVDLSKTGALTADGTQASSVLWAQDQAVSYRDTANYSTGDGKALTLRLSSVYTTAEGTYTLDVDVAQNLVNIASQAVTYNFNMAGKTWAFTPVPEPTAMALLMIGAMVFGLRRKIRK